jgi:D-alanine-D-alanine ligase
MKRIAVLYGGISSEHEVSTISGLQVYEKLVECGYEPCVIGITKEGNWFLQNPVACGGNRLSIIEKPELKVTVDPGRGLLCGAAPLQVDYFLPLTHGSFGEDGSLQGLLELLPIPFIGSSHFASSLAMKKSLGKMVAEKEQIPLLSYLLFSEYDNRRKIEKRVAETIGFPCIIKPECGGSSVGVSRVDTPDKLHEALDRAFSHDASILVESFGSFEEIECTVLGSDDHIITTRTGTILSLGTIYSYDRKYLEDSTRFILPSAFPDQHTEQKIREYAHRIHAAMGCSGFTRVDFFYQRDNRLIYFNELNTIPGLTSASLCMKLAELSGIGWDRFFKLMIQDADHQFRKRRRGGV